MVNDPDNKKLPSIGRKFLFEPVLTFYQSFSYSTTSWDTVCFASP